MCETVVTAANCAVNGYAGLKMSNATKRSAAVQKASFQWQKEESLRIKTRGSQENTDELDDEKEDGPDPSSRRRISLTIPSPLRRRPEVETRSSKTMGHLKGKRKAAIKSIGFPSAPTSNLLPGFPPAPTSPFATEIQSNDGESKIQDALQQRKQQIRCSRQLHRQRPLTCNDLKKHAGEKINVRQVAAAIVA
jgi:hypothetical protein